MTSTAAPSATPSSAPVAAASSATVSAAASLSLGALSQTAQFGPVGSGVTGAMTAPATSSGTGTAQLAFSVALPGGVPALAAVKRAGAAAGGAPSAIAFISFTPATNTTLAASPSFTFALAPGSTLPAGASTYVAFYDPTSANGWTNLAGPGTAGPAGTYTFGANAAGMSFKAGTTYDFAWYSTAAVVSPPTPTPTPTATAAASATPFPGGATLVATFTSGVPAAAHSATFSFSGPAGTGSQTVALPANCAAPTCNVSVSAPSGVSTAQILLYASANGTGGALAYASVSVSAPQVQSTAQNVALVGIMSSYAITLNPATVTIGQATTIATTVSALDAAGETLAPGYVSTAFVTPSFTESVTDPTGAVTTGGALSAAFSGVGSGPATLTVQSAGYPAASATPTYAPAAPLAIDYATGVQPSVGNQNFNVTISGFAGSTARNFVFPGSSVRNFVFDPNGTLWVQSAASPMMYFGVKTDGTLAGTLTASGPILTFDLGGNVYALGAASASSTVNVYSPANGSMTLLRSITAASAVCAAAPGPGGVLYVALCAGGVYAYDATANGPTTPLGGNAAASAPIATDSAGNVYASLAGIAKWNAGTFGSGSPAVTYVYLSAEALNQAIPPSLIAVDTAGNIYADYNYYTSNNALVVFPNGATTSTMIAQSQYSPIYVATPLK